MTRKPRNVEPGAPKAVVHVRGGRHRNGTLCGINRTLQPASAVWGDEIPLCLDCTPCPVCMKKYEQEEKSRDFMRRCMRCKDCVPPLIDEWWVFCSVHYKEIRT